MRNFIITLAMLSLAACQSMAPVVQLPPTPPVAIPEPVKIPVPVPCQTMKPERIIGGGDFPDTAAALKTEQDWGKRVNLLASGWPLRNDYIERLEKAFESCVAGARPSP